jgi:hypothetical protein
MVREGRKVSHVAQRRSDNEVVCGRSRARARGYRKFNNVRINNAGVLPGVTAERRAALARESNRANNAAAVGADG